MSAVAFPSTPAVDALMGAISCLSRQEKKALMERVQGQIEDDDSETDTIPSWHLEILEERQRLSDAGLDQPVSLEEGLRQVRERLRARGIMVP